MGALLGNNEYREGVKRMSDLKFLDMDESIDLLKEDVIHEFDGNEKEFETFVESNLEEIFANLDLPPIKTLRRQSRLQFSGFKIIMDLFVIHDDDSISIIEVKKPNWKYPSNAPMEQNKAIGQLLLYKSVVESFYGRKAKLFLIDNKIHTRTMYVFRDIELPITLIEVQKDRVFIPYSHGLFEESEVGEME